MAYKDAESKKKYDKERGREYRSRPEVQEHRKLYSKYYAAKTRGRRREYARDYCLYRRYKFTDEEIADKLESQNGVCVYSGLPLTRDGNLSVDHIKPKSEHPELVLDKKNLQFVDWYVNHAKNDLSEDEFLLLVKLIYEFRGLATQTFPGVSVPLRRKCRAKKALLAEGENYPGLIIKTITPAMKSYRFALWKEGLGDEEIANKTGATIVAIRGWRNDKHLKANHVQKPCIDCGKQIFVYRNVKRCPECRAKLGY
jgi:5-methylcytosine-specific restriction endonuclease McrA